MTPVSPGRRIVNPGGRERGRVTCPYLVYRRSGDGLDFDHDRAYCTAADQFVQPMRADICNDRYDLDHERHCEIYLDAADERPDPGGQKEGEDP